MNVTDCFPLRNDELAAVVSRQGGSLQCLTFAGRNLMVPAGGPQKDMANFPLVPFGNRVEFNEFTFNEKTYRFRPNSTDPLYVHGDGWLCEWSPTSVQDTAIALELKRYPDGHSPYEYTARQRILLGQDVATFELSVTNESSETMLFGLGQHPFFVRTPLVQVRALVTDFWSERSGHLPGARTALPIDLDIRKGSVLPNRFLNNALVGWDGMATIEWPELQVSATIVSVSKHTVMMIYAPIDRNDFFCLEPMTHLPNGFNMERFGGLTPLGRGETLHSRIAIQFRRLGND